jgi:dolichyl-phosphate-mannose-protein mannosyltransferase
MGFIGQGTGAKRSWFLFFLAGIAAGLVLRFQLAGFAEMPGHGDSAFYYTVAKNIAEGRGPVVDYIVYFFSGLLPLPHYAGDFWNPTASFLISVPMILFGKTVSSALIAPILAGILPAIAGFLAGRKYSGSPAIASLTGILTFFSPFQVWFSVTTEAIIFSGAFGAVAIYLMMKADERPRWFLLAAVFTGMANLIRQDNILLFAALEVCILVAPLTWKNRLVIAGGALVIHLLILSPLLVRNYAEFRAPFPPGPAKTAFLTTYEDFHAYGKETDWKTLRAAWGIRGILARRLHTAWENLPQVNYFVDPVLTTLFLVAAADAALLRRKWARLRLLLPAFLFAVLEYLFYSFVASFSGPGSLIKSLGVLMPFICLLIVDLLANYLHPIPLLIGATVVLAAYSGYRGFEKNYSSTVYYNGVYREYGVVRSLIAEDARRKGLSEDDVTVMARDTWDVYEGTGYKTVMVPNNDLDTILFVARHYDAQYVLLPAERPQLDGIYTGTQPDPRFQFVAVVPNSDLKIFWVDFGR